MTEPVAWARVLSTSSGVVSTVPTTYDVHAAVARCVRDKACASIATALWSMPRKPASMVAARIVRRCLACRGEDVCEGQVLKTPSWLSVSTPAHPQNGVTARQHHSAAPFPRFVSTQMDTSSYSDERAPHQSTL